MILYIVNIRENIPIIVYDDLCYLCTKFAKIVNFLARGNLTIIGHYTNQGKEIREQILDDSALEMFWLVDEKIAYGGRAAIFPLLRAIITSKNKIQFIECESFRWLQLIEILMKIFHTSKKEKCILVKYEDLRKNTQLELRKIFDFLDANVSDDKLKGIL